MTAVPSAPLPVVGVTAGPQWASMVNTALGELQSTVGQLATAQPGGIAVVAAPSGIDDTAAINAAIALLPKGGSVYGGTVQLQAGTYRIASKILLPNGVGLRGVNAPGTQILALASFNDTAMISTEKQDGSQTYAYLEDLSIAANSGGGAICSVAAVDFVSLGSDTHLRNVFISGS